MKRLIILLAALCLVIVSQAQNDSTTLDDALRRGPDIHTGTSCTVPENRQLHLDFGLSAGATLFSDANDHSPYYSHHGFTLQLPLMAHWSLTPSWKFSTGLRYDFNWAPLYYAVEPIHSEWRFEEPYEEYGLQFNQTPSTATQKAYAYHSYIGIPVEIKWYPWHDKKILGVALDIFAAYAVTQYFNIENVTPHEDGFNWDGYQKSTFNAMNPWKLEVGLSLTSGMLGLSHGIRFFANLLPTYTDPTTGEKFYTSGMTLFL